MPEGFARYRVLFPATPALTLPDMAATDTFVRRWRRAGHDAVGALAQAVRGARRTGGGAPVVVLVRGYLGNYMRGNLVSACRALREAGLDTFIAKTRAGGTIADNAAALARQVPAGRAVIWAGHSKGGLEALMALARDEALAVRTRAVILSQTPRGPSRVLESVLCGRHASSLGPGRQRAEALQRLGLTLLGARAGGRELTAEPLAAIIARIDEMLTMSTRPTRSGMAPFRVMQTASWSTRPTTWLDSFHERLGEVRPGVAHDGQFYLDDLLWPGDVEHVLLPHLDHAQPVMDGFGFDSARYWATLVAGVIDPARTT